MQINMEHFKDVVRHNLNMDSWRVDPEEGCLMLLELMVKRQGGCYNSASEDRFLERMKVLRKDGTPNALGRRFMMEMLYESSTKRPMAYNLMKEYRS